MAPNESSVRAMDLADIHVLVVDDYEDTLEVFGAAAATVRRQRPEGSGRTACANHHEDGPRERDRVGPDDAR